MDRALAGGAERRAKHQLADQKNEVSYLQSNNHTIIGSSLIMNPTLRNILAVIVGFLVGSVVNLGLVETGMAVVPLPEGADVSTMDGLREAMKSFTPANFIFPFLGHALGTLAGAFVAAKIAASHKMKFAIGIGVCFLIGGIAMVSMCGGPLWFIAADLLAYLPMGFLGGTLAHGKKPQAT